MKVLLYALLHSTATNSSSTVQVTFLEIYYPF